MNALSAVRGHAVTRVVVGAALTVAPERAAAGWIGKVARKPGATVMVRALGIRDASLGAGILVSAGDANALRPWLAACAAADVVDCAASLAVRDSLPKGGRITLPLVAGGSAILCAALFAALD